MPLVSVVVPTRNSSRTLDACLRSVQEQTLKDLEVIVIDNSSTDDSIEIARRYAHNVETWGPERSAQRNFGARLAKGSYLVFVDSDMMLSPTVLAECQRLSEDTGSPAIIVPEVTVGKGFWAQCRALERSCYLGDDSIEAARFFRRDAFEGVGGYDEDLIAGEDWDLSVRVALGKRLPRTDARVLHDEGHLRLRDHLGKKRYYAASLRRYWAKHPQLATRQLNVIGRRAFLRNWRRLLRHPLLGPSVLLLKSLEVAVSVPVIVQPTKRSTQEPRT